MNNGIALSPIERGTGNIENIMEKILFIDNLEKAFNKQQKGKGKYSREAIAFAMDEIYNLLQLKVQIINKTYKVDGYISFIVTDPKVRKIDAPHCKDKIVQLAINNVLKEIYQPKFIYDTYACLDEKGTHKCVARIQYFMRKAKWEYGEDAIIVKIDIKQFFYTIIRVILKEIVAKTIKEKDTLELLYIIIDSADMIDILGLPLGNTLSQLFSNIYLNEIDQYAKRGLGIKYYIRYADDIIIIVKNKERAKEVLQLIRVRVEVKLGMKLNDDKSKIFPIAQGVNAIGFKIYPTHMLLRDNSKKDIKRKLKKFRPMLIKEEITIEKVEQILNSWYGHAEQSDCYKFVQSLLERFDYIKIIKKKNKKGKLKYVFKIKREVIENARKLYNDGEGQRGMETIYA